MYALISNLLRKIFPAAWLQKNQIGLRKIYANFFVPKGECYCSVCNQSLREFVPIDKNELLCPACGSGKRHRRLFYLMQEEIKQGKSILDFSPNVGFKHYAKQKWKELYSTSNYDPKDSTDFHFDITAINHSDNAFDVIICYHVLEHIVNDRKAISELYRILKPGGYCYIQSPFKEGHTYEDFSINTAAERLIHFHQEDHVRIYSAEGLGERLKAAGFDLSIIQYKASDKPNEHKKNGYKTEEIILKASKKTDTTLK
jgi:SAM-dependent methyltransferase